ncbi:MAG: hypothetical protein WC372_07120 [Candidatus Neomarinimicrobiota bacterium]|nr:hypothetical protein [Candidatus Neomarinimicrobiota bacterium]MDD3965913.1 hypothetical protein [Candidatus Neomarinimicrobiota bacterium]MDX9780889.1 hypothetical protein [bacterium]
MNHEYIQKNGLSAFLERQALRIRILSGLLEYFDDGRSKAFYCRYCALLAPEQLGEVQGFAAGLPSSLTLKEKSKGIREFLTQIANTADIETILH